MGEVRKSACRQIIDNLRVDSDLAYEVRDSAD